MTIKPSVIALGYQKWPNISKEKNKNTMLQKPAN